MDGLDDLQTAQNRCFFSTWACLSLFACMDMLSM